MNKYKWLAYHNAPVSYSDKRKARVVNMERAIEMLYRLNELRRQDLCRLPF